MRDGGLALAVFHMVPRVPAAPNLFVHPPADLRKVLLPPSSRPARLLRLTVFCPASSGDGSSIVGRGRRPPRAYLPVVRPVLVFVSSGGRLDPSIKIITIRGKSRPVM